jgi:hypothetical protein
MSSPAGQFVLSRRWLLPVLALMLQPELAAAGSISISTSAPAFDAEAHSQVCHCGSRCRHASCCCGRTSAFPDVQLPRKAEEDRSSSTANSAPCLNEAPCGEPGPPDYAPSGAPGRDITLPSFSLSRREAPSGFTLPRAPFRIPRRLAGRIDRPPRPLPRV